MSQTLAERSGEPWATPSYCSACHMNHPGPCGCACHRPAASGQRVTDYWTDGLKFYATGRTSEALRVMAADEEMTRGLAILSGITPEEERAEILGIAGAIDALKAEGLTREQAYFLAGLDRILGIPFSEFTPALLSAA